MRTIVLLLILLSAARAEEEDPRKIFLLKIGKAFKSGNAAAIARYFPGEGKVQLRLKGVKSGRYRDEQARSLLFTYFRAIQPKEYKLKEIRGSVGTFRMKYRVRADGREVKGTTHVFLEKEGESWRIVGIVES